MSRRRPLGWDATEHRDQLTERLSSARRFYADAKKHAQKGNCSGAITSLMLGSSYEGEAQAHAEASSGGDGMTKVRALMGIRDKTQTIVIKACAR